MALNGVIARLGSFSWAIKKCHYRGTAGERLENEALRLKALQAHFYCYWPPQGLWEEGAKGIPGAFVL